MDDRFVVQYETGDTYGRYVVVDTTTGQPVPPIYGYAYPEVADNDAKVLNHLAEEGRA